MVNLVDLIPGDRIRVSVTHSGTRYGVSPSLQKLMGEQVVTVIAQNKTLEAVDCVFKGVGVSIVFENEILEKLED